MLTIRCAGCKSKLFKYRKIGPGEVLRCHKSRITKVFAVREEHGRLKCLCGSTIGIDLGGFYKMKSDRFTYSGTKDSK
ncbi:MAG: hypothetical protein ACOC0U_07370 [Desulfovibrionales bacterium]